MEKRGITSLELGEVRITYIGPGKQKRLDTDRLRTEKPEIYEKYSKETTVSSQIRIKLKG